SLWNTEPAGSGKTAGGYKLEVKDGFQRFDGNSPIQAKIQDTALSPSGTQVVWVEQVKQSEGDVNLYKVSLLKTSKGPKKDLKSEKVLKEGYRPDALAVTDNGLVAIAQGTELRLGSLNDFPQSPIKFKEEIGRIVCLSFSPNNQN